jgi:peptidoglycan/LPS O-acetylase OafA/YrhL
MSYPGFPADNGPAWAGFLLYGHLAVVVFIVLSGFSLGIGPARSDWHVDSLGRYAHRRAWRILPPYWAALIFSLVIATTLVPQPGEAVPTAKSVLVFGTLMQDVVGAPSPNGAFWSIAVEAQLYIALPVLLILLRRAGALALLAAVTVPVLLIGIFAPSVAAAHLFVRFTPQFLVAFTVGMLAAATVNGKHRERPWHWYALIAAIPCLVLIAVMGSVWTVGHYFWVDLLLAPAVALLISAVAAGRPRPFVRLLDWRPVRSLGSFSYSLYLVHAPIVIAVATLIIAPRIGHGTGAFLLTLAIAVPLSVGFARLFAAVFDLPFQHHKSWAALGAAAKSTFRRSAPGEPVPAFAGVDAGYAEAGSAAPAPLPPGDTKESTRRAR